MSNLAFSLTATSPLGEWLSYLENSHSKAIDLGLARIKSVAETLDLLQPAPFVITVGGTNGKGTTCRLLEMILINAGLRVGVYSSPHLIRYNERVRIQNQELDDIEHTSSFAFIEQHKTESLTYFEFSTLSALYLFKQAKLDVVILEVGLGGRLDATNIVDSDIAVITSIDIDHVDFLGSDREQIGFEKAGIFRQNCPAIVGEPNIPQSILQQGEKLTCRLSCRDRDWAFQMHDHDWSWHTLDNKVRLENLPFCQIPLQNAATALAVLPYLPFSISRENITKSLEETTLSGRFQPLSEQQLHNIMIRCHKTVSMMPTVIVDVGHNPHAARYLAEKLTALGNQADKRIVAVCGMLQDKDAQGVAKPLLPLIDHWYCVTLSGYRGQSGEQLAKTLAKTAQTEQTNFSFDSYDSVKLGVEAALQHCRQNDILLVFGSFHTVGEFLQNL